MRTTLTFILVILATMAPAAERQIKSAQTEQTRNAGLIYAHAVADRIQALLDANPKPELVPLKPGATDAQREKAMWDASRAGSWDQLASSVKSIRNRIKAGAIPLAVSDAASAETELAYADDKQWILKGQK